MKLANPVVTRRVQLLSMALSLTAIASADILEVGGPNEDYATIQEAVNAAVSGDTVLVGAGAYSGFGINGKGVSVVAVEGALVRVKQEIAIRNLPEGEQIDLVGLTVKTNTAKNRGLVAANNQGVIWIEECLLDGYDSTPDPGSPPFSFLPDTETGALVLNTQDLVLIRCQLKGGNGYSQSDEHSDPYSTSGWHGLIVENSEVHLFECEVTGGYGGSWYDTTSASGMNAGDGMNISGRSFVYASGTHFTGGGGGWGGDGSVWLDPYDCGHGGDGGHAVELGPDSQFLHRDCLYSPGQGGEPGFQSMCFFGANGLEIASVQNAAQLLSGSAKTLAVQSPVTEGTSTTVTIQGAPGDLCWAQTALELDPVYLGGLESPRLVSLPRRLLFMGTLDSNGQLTRILPVPSLASPSDSLSSHLQGYFRDTTGGAVLGSGGHLLVLGSAY